VFRYPEPELRGGCAMVIGVGLVLAVLIVGVLAVIRRKD
jgi:hypothetical protein